MEKIRILLIEDNRLLRESITTNLSKQPDFEIFTRMENTNAIELIDINKAPHIVLLDFRLPFENSLSLLRTIANKYPEMKSIAFNIVPDEVDIIEIIKAGGSGFLPREASCSDFVKTIRKVAQGENVLPSHLTNALFSQIANYCSDSVRCWDQKVIQLTKREHEIIDLILSGFCNKEIAQQLHISAHTVKSHIHNILKKLALKTRLQLASFSHAQKSQLTNPVVSTLNHFLFESINSYYSN